jgi:hypothetical protein
MVYVLQQRLALVITAKTTVAVMVFALLTKPPPPVFAPKTAATILVTALLPPMDVTLPLAQMVYVVLMRNSTVVEMVCAKLVRLNQAAFWTAA